MHRDIAKRLSLIIRDRLSKEKHRSIKIEFEPL